MMTEEERKREEARAQLAQTDQLLKNRAEERARREKADADRKRGIIGNVQRGAADELVEAGAKRQPMALTGQDAEEYFKERDNLKRASAAAGKAVLGVGEKQQIGPRRFRDKDGKTWTLKTESDEFWGDHDPLVDNEGHTRGFTGGDFWGDPSDLTEVTQYDEVGKRRLSAAMGDVKSAQDRLGRLETRGRQNVIDLKNRQAHEAINQQYGDLIRQGKASPFHALLAHQEQQRRYEEKTRLQGDYEKLQKEQDERQKAAQAAAEDLHKRMGSSTYAVFTALDRLNDPDLSDSERASTLSVAAAAAQKLGDQFVENKYGADSGYRSEVVKVEGENPTTGRMAVGYEIMVKDRNGNPAIDYRTGRPLVMKLDADRARKAMEQHFGYEFRTDENGKTVFGVGGEEGGTVSDPTGRQFARHDFGSMQVGDRIFGGQYSAKTREEMAKQQREQQQADDAHALNDEKIESSKSSREMATKKDARDERVSQLQEEAMRLKNKFDEETDTIRKDALQKQIDHINAQISHLQTTDALATKADARADAASSRADAESQAKIESIQAETALTREKTAQLVKAGQEAKAAGAAEQEKFVRDTSAALMKDAQFRDRYKDADEAARAAKRVARNLAGLDGGDETTQEGVEKGRAEDLINKAKKMKGRVGSDGMSVDSSDSDIVVQTPNKLLRTGGKVKSDRGDRFFDPEDLEEFVDERTGKSLAVAKNPKGGYFVSKTELPKAIDGKENFVSGGLKMVRFNVAGAGNPAKDSAQETVVEILRRMGYEVLYDVNGNPAPFEMPTSDYRKLMKYIETETMPMKTSSAR